MVRRTGLLCASVAAGSCEQLAGKASAALAMGSDLVELRLDRLKRVDLGQVRRRLQRFARRSVITVRSRAQGGDFDGSDRERVELISSLAEMNPAYVDVELETARRHPGILGAMGRGTRSIVSWHDLAGTPDVKVLRRVRREADALGSVVKVVTTAKKVEDNLVTLSLYAGDAGSRPLVAFCMGAEGVVSRLLALRLGSPLMYVSLPDEAVAPGQLSIGSMRSLITMWGGRG